MASVPLPDRASDCPDIALLAFSLGPVQSFIASARSIRDLWTGSYLLAWLTRHAMAPIRDKHGPEAFISPAVKEHEGEYFRQGSLRSPCLPNRFLATVPALGAEILATASEQACRKEWDRICGLVLDKLDPLVKGNCANAAQWSRQWLKQVWSFFDIRTVLLPVGDCSRTLLGDLIADEMRTRTGTKEDCFWGDCFELVGNLLAADKLIRHVPDYQPEPDEEGRFAQKCFVLGTYEQMGPSKLEHSTVFWENFADSARLLFARTRKRERLCALSLVKRFAWSAVLAPKHNMLPSANWFEDTASVATARWTDDKPLLKNYALQRLSSQWLYWSKRDQGKDNDEDPVTDNTVWSALLNAREQEPPPTYYAILTMDGDKMGDRFRNAVGASGRRAISAALSDFALNRVPEIVSKNSGTLVYSGGDDALVLLPTETAILCAQQMELAFRRTWQEHGLAELDKAHVSAGIAVAHHKEDLRFVLEMARRAEKAGKVSGRNTLMLTVCRRSGEHASALCSWSFADTVCNWVEQFRKGASDRWAYQLKGELPTLRALPHQAMRVELLRHLRRREASTKAKLLPDDLVLAFDRYLEFVNQDHRKPHDAAFWSRSTNEQEQYMAGRALEGFLTLCQSASFLARGRDQ